MKLGVARLNFFHVNGVDTARPGVTLKGKQLHSSFDVIY